MSIGSRARKWPQIKERYQDLTRQFPTHRNREFIRPNRELNGGIRELFGRIREEAIGLRFLPRSPGYEGPLCYCRPGVLSVNPARRNAAAIVSALADTGWLEPARLSPGRRRFSDPAGAISARAVVGRASGA